MKNYWYNSTSRLLKQTEGKKAIMVDFFDTIIFRRVHSSQIYYQWAKTLIARLEFSSPITSDEIVYLRHKINKQLRKEYFESPFKEVMSQLYEQLKNKIMLSKEDFISICLEADISVELGCQYPNNHLISFLRKAKARGQRIYIISDFYLPILAYNNFLINAGCNDIFDGIFVSETYNKTKSNGSIYPFVLTQIGLEAKDCIMLGDSKTSDVIQANKHGIEGLWYFPLFHKIHTNISRIFNIEYSKRIIKKQASYLYQHSDFDEYSIILFFFAQNLIKTAISDGVKKLVFVSRGGYFLKCIVDEYLKSLNIKNIHTDYCYVSRKVCLSNNKNELSLLKEYLEQFLDEGKLVTVDEGWYCHSQQSISKELNIPTLGYYLGVRGKDKGYSNCIRKGILFDFYRNNGKPSKYYGIFCTNCSMYEQMLTSRDGSVIGYEKTENILKPILKDNDIEIKLYDEIINNWQKRMLLIIKGLCAWHIDKQINEKLLAQTILKTSLFSNNKRCQLLQRLDGDMINNYGNAKQIAKGISDVHIDFLKLLRHPDMYTGMVCKIQRKIYNKKVLNIIYKCLASCFYTYIRLIKRI